MTHGTQSRRQRPPGAGRRGGLRGGSGCRPDDDETVRDFAEGQEHTHKQHRGDFAEGQEQHDNAEEDPEGDFAEGQQEDPGET